MNSASKLAVLIVLAAAGCRGPVDPQGHERFTRELGSSTLTVFPAHVNRAGAREWDTPAAERIARLLGEERWFDARTSAIQIPLPLGWHMNQARMLRDGAEAFAVWVREHPIETRYALIADYLLGDRAAVGVHVFVVDAQGTIVHVSLWNSHWEPFQEVDPKTIDECTQVVLRGLRGQWSKPAAERDRAAPR